jgi:hypothetical protein
MGFFFFFLIFKKKNKKILILSKNAKYTKENNLGGVLEVKHGLGLATYFQNSSLLGHYPTQNDNNNNNNILIN